MSARLKEQLDLEGIKDHINNIFGKSNDFIAEPAIVEAVNDQVPSTVFGKIYAFFDAWSQHSYYAWEKAGRPIE
jgi:hypothetical protein